MDKNISAYNIFVFLQFCLYFTVRLFWKCTHIHKMYLSQSYFLSGNVSHWWLLYNIDADTKYQ